MNTPHRNGTVETDASSVQTIRAVDRLPFGASKTPTNSCLGGRDEWFDYWETLKPDSQLYHEQSAEYVQNLRTAFHLTTDITILDFGSGFGYTTAMLAEHVGIAYAWDRSENMRRETSRRTAHHANVKVIDGSHASALAEGDAVDLILVNSVVQYMEWSEILAWTETWKRILAPGGAIVISDAIPHDYNGMGDIFHVLRLSVRRGFFFEALRTGSKEIVSYLIRRQARRLTRLDHGDLRAAGLQCDLDIIPLRSNLTHFPGRNSTVLHHPAQIPTFLKQSWFHPLCDKTRLRHVGD